MGAYTRHSKKAKNKGRHRYLLKLEVKLKGQPREVLDQIETFRMQKSRVEATQDGDRNIHHFHTSMLIITEVESH